MNAVRRLLRFRERHRSSQQNNNNAGPEAPCPPMLNVPNEILMTIIDHLNLHDQFLLSQTCTATRKLTHRNWELDLQGLSRAEQIKFWTGLAYVLPNHWVCGPCGKLHAIKKWDGPGKENYWILRCQPSW